MLNCNCNCECNCRMDDNDRQKLLDLVNQSSFAAYDMLLYLDTHPDDMEAQAFYHKNACLRRDSMNEYSRQYGPLTMDTIDSTHSDRWDWMMQPWPWEMEKKRGCRK